MLRPSETHAFPQMKLSFLSVSAAVFLMAAQCGSAATNDQPAPVSAERVSFTEEVPPYAPRVLRSPPAAPADEQNRLFDAAAAAAWKQIDKGYRPETGLVDAQTTWQYPTAWDIASSLAAFYSARGLGLLSEEEYKKRASRMLATLARVRLYQGIAYGRNYDSRNGELVGDDQKPSEHGSGYSAMDLGRLLAVLAIVAKNDPDLAEAARVVATRVRADRVIRDGYLHGTEISKATNKRIEYQEGRLGYEQYAAAGFALWNMRAPNALNARANATRASVLGIPMTGDRRGLDRMTSEPFLLQGLELGFDPTMKEMAWQTLSAQAARFEKTGQVTMVSEDAINRPPHYFYYYCVFCSGKPFVINVHTPGLDLDEPRWVSTKAAFGWHALIPTDYTWRAVQSVQPALHPQNGWASGVFEQTGRSTETYSLNSAALILEAALYRRTGRPLIEAAR